MFTISFTNNSVVGYRVPDGLKTIPVFKNKSFTFTMNIDECSYTITDDTNKQYPLLPMIKLIKNNGIEKYEELIDCFLDDIFNYQKGSRLFNESMFDTCELRAT